MVQDIFVISLLVFSPWILEHKGSEARDVGKEFKDEEERSGDKGLQARR